MKLTPGRVIFTLFFVSLMLDGIVAELLTVLCFTAAIILEKENNKFILGKRFYHGSLLFTLIFFGLFLIHVVFVKLNDVTVIRFYGLTKNMCFPLLILLAFTNECRDRYSIRLVLLVMVFFNILYSIPFLTIGNMYSFSYLLGSVNVCSGIDIVLIPVAAIRIREKKQPSSIEGQGAGYCIIEYLFLLTSAFLILVADSTTSLLLFLVEILMFFSSVLFSYIRGKRSYKWLVVGLTLGIVILILLIAKGTIKLDPEDLKTRVGIWRTAYDQFIDNDTIHLLLGTGNDIVHMVSKDLEPHNMIMEILKIHGIIGLFVFICLIMFILKTLNRYDTHKLKPFLLSFVFYFIICCMHPFFTGSTLFQFCCSIGLISLFLKCRPNWKYQILGMVRHLNM